MLTTLLGDALELGSLKRLIVERTEGNPFFIEEMIQSLFEQGVLTRNGTVRLAKSISELRVPASAGRSGSNPRRGMWNGPERFAHRTYGMRRGLSRSGSWTTESTVPELDRW